MTPSRFWNQAELSIRIAQSYVIDRCEEKAISNFKRTLMFTRAGYVL